MNNFRKSTSKFLYINLNFNLFQAIIDLSFKLKDTGNQKIGNFYNLLQQMHHYNLLMFDNIISRLKENYIKLKRTSYYFNHFIPYYLFIKQSFPYIVDVTLDFNL